MSENHNVRVDLTGKVFGKLEVVKFAGMNKYRQSEWWCKCKCGNPDLVKVLGFDLITKRTKSCGCQRKENGAKVMAKVNASRDHALNMKDITGKTYGDGYTRVTVLESAGTSEKRKAMWKCRCSCGNIFIAEGKLLRNGKIKSCGCRKKTREEIKRKYGDDYVDNDGFIHIKDNNTKGE